MEAVFPSSEWLVDLEAKLNSDARYAEIARNWEGELVIIVKPEGALEKEMTFFLDLWHGRCRKAEILAALDSRPAAFVLTAGYGNITRILKGELDPLQAMMTRKLQVQGSMAYMMRNVPTVLDFVRCAREVTGEILA